MDDGIPQLTDAQRDFHVEEYKALRAEVVAQGDKYDRFKVWLPVAVTAYLGWAVNYLSDGQKGASCTSAPAQAVFIISFLPFFAALVSASAASYYLRFFRTYSAYARRLECTLGHKELGWEGHWRGLLSQKAKDKQDCTAPEKDDGLVIRIRNLTVLASDPFWPVMTLTSLALGLVLFLYAEAHPCAPPARHHSISISVDRQ